MKKILALCFSLCTMLPIGAQTDQSKRAHTTTQTNKKTSKGSTSKRMYNYANDNKEWVDLGLPSGTLWATCNIGAKSPEEYGDYFAWGETIGYKNGKEIFDGNRNTHKYMRDYVAAIKYTVDDNKRELDLSDDAAYVNWGENWCIPSVQQMNELITECNCSWTFFHGTNGLLIESRHNSNFIFLPAAGEVFVRSFCHSATIGCYHTRSTHEFRHPDNCYLTFNDTKFYGVLATNRTHGFSIRAVRIR